MRLAGVQGGAIGHAQLIECGLSLSGIQRRRRAGDLRDRHKAVYALGRPDLTPYGEAWAAFIAANGRGVLSHWSAAAAVGAASWPREPELLVVGGPLRLDRVIVRRTRKLSEDEIATNSTGLKATWWPRTLTDLAEHSSIAELQHVLDRLERNGRFDEDVLQQAIRNANGKRGFNKLHQALEPFTTISEADYRSLLERFSALLLQTAELPPHEINGPVTIRDGPTIHVDILFRAQRLAIEVDGRNSHDRSLQFGHDRYRDRELQKLGFRVVRFTWQDVVHRPQTVLDDIRALLTLASHR